jgi:hypothetical protein
LKKKRLVLFAWIVAVAIGITFSLSPLSSQNETTQFQTMDSGSRKAVIIDQLHNELPSEKFQDKVTQYLTDAGYKVDLYTTDEITIDFYKKLPAMNYEYIVIRTHALGSGVVDKSASLFTGEKYSDHKYIKEQFLGHIGKGIPILYGDMKKLTVEEIVNKAYYVIGSKFVEEVMIGSFQKSTIILAGCETTKNSLLAESFLKRGASEVIGWSGLVDSNKNISVLLQIFNSTFGNDVEMIDAIEEVMKINEGTFFEPTNLVYFSNEA